MNIMFCHKHYHDYSPLNYHNRLFLQTDPQTRCIVRLAFFDYAYAKNYMNCAAKDYRFTIVVITPYDRLLIL